MALANSMDQLMISWYSKNRGGFETARFLAKLMSLAPNIIAINTAYNLMPLESLTVICSALKLSKGICLLE
jgi:hypothetical protein